MRWVACVLVSRDAAQKILDDEKAAKLAIEMEAIAKKKKEKADELQKLKAAQKAKIQAEADKKAAEAAADVAACEVAGLGPVPTELSDAELEALPDFADYSGVDSASYQSLPPFQRPMKMKKARAAYTAKMEAQVSDTS
jgi:hypothetical protein